MNQCVVFFEIMDRKVQNLFCCDVSASEPEVLILVFELLDGNSLKEAALVCKRWNRLIGTTALIMNKFVLNLRNHTEDDMKRLSALEKERLRIKRHFTSTHVDMYRCKGIDIVAKLLIHFGPNLLNLTFFCPADPTSFSYELIISSSCLKEILQSMPYLKSLDLHGVQILKDDPKRICKKFPMAKLQMLKVGVKSACLVEMISAPQLEGFDNLSLDSFSTTTITKLMKASTPPSILANEKNLKTFYYHCTKSEQPAAALRLDRLEFTESFKVEDDETFAQLQKFLRSQAYSLRSLRFRSMADQHNPRGLYKTIFMELRTLRVLQLDFNLLPVDDEFYNQLQPMRSLKEIYVEESFPSRAAAERFLGLCPNIFRLNAMEDMTIAPMLLNFLSVHNPRIQNILLTSIQGETIPEMPSLESLYIMYGYDRFEEFADVNPHVEMRGGVARWL